MCQVKFILPFMALFSIAIFSSCEKEKSCADEISDQDVKVIHYYNAYFDFFNAVDALDFEELETANILFDKGESTEYAKRFELNFPTGYKDESKNEFYGRMHYFSRNEVGNSEGNEVVIEFENLIFNGIDVAGRKVMQFDAEANVDWCTENNISFVFGSENIALGGCLAKARSNSSLTISGSNTLIVNGIEYQVEITDPLVRQDDCIWFTSGKLTITNEKIKVLKFEEKCSDINMTLSNKKGCKSMKLKEKHDLW